jgi:DNA-binding NarL/FixJ family response regulator
MNPKLHAHFDKFKSSGLLLSPKGPALAVVKLTHQDDITNKQLEHMNQADPALVARLLKLANACRTHGTRPILAIREAIGILGLNAVRGLALGFSVMKGQNARPSLPIIALTADAFEEDRLHCKAVGMDDFLTKPIALEALKAAMLQWLAQAPAEKSA